jgi:hypothetical protein
VTLHRAIRAWLPTLLLAACGPGATVCPQTTGTPRYLKELPTAAAAATRLPSAPIPVRVRGGTITVDQVVSGPLCNGSWSGTVYVTCDVQVRAWEGKPTFLEDCDLAIAPGTVVYVADHNDAAYYNGCSCHTGETGEP